MRLNLGLIFVSFGNFIKTMAGNKKRQRQEMIVDEWSRGPPLERWKLTGLGSPEPPWAPEKNTHVPPETDGAGLGPVGGQLGSEDSPCAGQTLRQPQ